MDTSMGSPRQFHFIFGLRPQTEPFHPVHYLCLRSCLCVQRPERILLHYQHEPWGPWWERIRPELDLERLDPVPFASRPGSWNRSDDYAHHADFLRVALLEEHGGAYADMDTLFLRPYPDRLWEEPASWVGSRTSTPPSADGGTAPSATR